MKPIPEHLELWIGSVVAAAPRHLRLIYLEWNDSLRGSQKQISFHAFGYSLNNFDPENPFFLSALSDWIWEPAGFCETDPEVAGDDQELGRSLKELFSTNPSLVASLLQRDGQIAFGRHECPMEVFPPPNRPQASTCYYELHVASQNNRVETLGFADLDGPELQQVIEHQKFDQSYPVQGTFHLQGEAGKAMSCAPSGGLSAATACAP
jgi:hypothetical protein